MRSTLCLCTTALAILLSGTIIVLSTVIHYFGVYPHDLIQEREMSKFQKMASKRGVVVVRRKNATTVQQAAVGAEEEDEDSRMSERIPRIIHQTWKVDQLPSKWQSIREECMLLHPEYEYRLWTDISAREFIAQEYPWFLSTFDGYPYAIQRADTIRYFVLHHFGGIYMDMDVGCKRPLDPLLYFPAVLPATIPVGLSNDVMLAEKNHPFLDLVINTLISFDHQYGTNYPTVMFSTGPMFLSAIYGIWARRNESAGLVRILPRRWYGKNAPLKESGDSFFEHYYGSSWHSDDAGFITFLGTFGVALMWTALLILVLAALRLFFVKAIPKAASHLRTPSPIANLLRPMTKPFESCSTSFSLTRRCISSPTTWLRRSSSGNDLPRHSRSSSTELNAGLVREWNEKDHPFFHSTAASASSSASSSFNSTPSSTAQRWKLLKAQLSRYLNFGLGMTTTTTTTTNDYSSIPLSPSLSSTSTTPTSSSTFLSPPSSRSSSGHRHPPFEEEEEEEDDGRLSV